MPVPVVRSGRLPIAALLALVLAVACAPPAGPPVKPTATKPPPRAGSQPSASPTGGASVEPTPAASTSPAGSAAPTATPASTPLATASPPPSARPATRPALHGLVEARLLDVARLEFNRGRGQLAKDGDARATMISAGAAGVISNNSSGLISDKGGGLIGDSGASYRLAQVPAAKLPPRPTISLVALAGEKLTKRRTFPDGTVALHFARENAADDEAFRVVHLRDGQPFREHIEEALERFPNGKIKRTYASGTEVLAGGAIASRSEAETLRETVDGPLRLKVLPGSYSRDELAGVGMEVQLLEMDTGTRTGTFRIGHTTLDVVETGTLTGVDEATLRLPFTDPLLAYDGTATAKLGDKVVLTRKVVTVDGKRVRSYELGDGLSLTLTPATTGTAGTVVPRLEGELAREGRRIAKVQLEVAPEGTATFTVVFDDAPAEPLVIGYGITASGASPLPSAGPQAVVTTLTGIGGPLMAAGLGDLTGLARSRTSPQKLFAADYKFNSIRVIDLATGSVTTLAGGGAGYQDGPGASARFERPRALAVAADDTIYVADTGNRRIRVVAPDGTVSTLAGDGSNAVVDGPGATAAFATTSGLALDAAGVLYVADFYGGRIRQVETSGAERGAVSTLAGSTPGAPVDGPAAQAVFQEPLALAFGPDGDLYVADQAARRIRKIAMKDPAHTVSTVVGTDDPARQGVDGAALETGIEPPRALDFDAEGRLTFAGVDYIRQLGKDGQVRTLAGMGVVADLDGLAHFAALEAVNCMHFIADGTLLFGDGRSLRSYRRL